MSAECRFEPGLARCTECGAPTDEPGTCEDFAYCWKCRKALVDIMGEEEGERIYGSYVLTAIEGHEYKPKHRVLHFNNGGGPVCHARGGPHPVTDNRNETNCKKCVQAIAAPQRELATGAGRGDTEVSG